MFWTAARRSIRTSTTSPAAPAPRAGQLGELFEDAGLGDIEATRARRRASSITTFDDWWEPFTLGVGPAGAHAAGLDAAALARLRDACRALIPDEPFVLEARAWAARGTSR